MFRIFSRAIQVESLRLLINLFKKDLNKSNIFEFNNTKLQNTYFIQTDVRFFVPN